MMMTTSSVSPQKQQREKIYRNKQANIPYIDTNQLFLSYNLASLCYTLFLFRFSFLFFL